ncbi:MAG TPA: iron-sulfur cluster assembly accessory protein [Anaerovoracaceae bacterium]|nr:iron-sulfur cluster assembly accessory protein [Anaerovoracaceae bacterium]
MDPKIELTSKAVEYVKNKLEERKTPQAALRLGIRGSGCNGYSYTIQYEDDPPGEKDLVFDFEGLKVIVDKKSILFLNGSILDYEKTVLQSGLKFSNPNQASSCGCGESFSVK